MTTRFADHLLTGIHSARPTATTVPAGSLYSCTTHGLIYQSDGTSWSTYATLGASTTVATDTVWDTKGDLAVATGADAASKLPVGSNGQILTADSTQTTGVKWAAAAGGGAWTLINTITLGSTGAIDFTSIPGTYNDLILTGLIRSARANALANCGLHLNNDSGTNYAHTYLLQTSTTTNSSASTTGQSFGPYILAVGDSAAAGAFTAVHIEILNYTSTTLHKYLLANYVSMDPAAATYSSTGGARWHPGTPAAVTRVTFWDNSSSSTNFITGSSIRLYGRT